MDTQNAGSLERLDREDFNTRLNEAQQHLGSATLQIAMRYPKMDLARSEEIAMYLVRNAILERYAASAGGFALRVIRALEGLSLTRLRSTRPAATTN